MRLALSISSSFACLYARKAKGRLIKEEMESYRELFLTAVITVILAILIKLASLGDADGHDPRASPPTATAAPHDRARHRPSLVAAGCGGVSVKKKRVRFQEISEEPVNDPLPAVEVSGSDRIEKTEVVGDDDRELIADHIESGESVRDLAEEIAGENESRGVEDVSLEIGKFEGRLGGEEVALEGIQGEECESGVGAGEKSGIGEEVLMEGSLLHGEDDWEGIERSELEDLFAAAMAYVGIDGGNAVSGLSSDVLMQLYGLQKVAVEGPCYESQPLALKVSARAKWHAWQRLGNMAQEVAMEQYISLLSDSISGWIGEKPGRNDCLNEGNDPHEEQGSGTRASDPSSSLHSSCKIDERLPTDSSHMECDDLSVSPKFSGQGISGAFFLNLLSPTTGRFLSFYW